MKLLRLRADGFGALRGEYHFSPDRLTLVVDENEHGKSTLLAAIVAALYGLEDDRRYHRVLSPAQRWRPWDGGSYRVELEFLAGGERLCVVRDFDQGTVEVWNDRGQEVTHDYREGKADYPIGQKLFGLDDEEFEKCAFLRQGELEQVVPAEEKARRASTLHARLENAADTRVGDTNAIEAMKVLGDACAEYNCAELESTLKVETAIARLETRCEYLRTEIRTLEHEIDQIAKPLEELARLFEEERAARDMLGHVETERREARHAEARQRLEWHEERQAALQDMQAEALSLESTALVPENAEAELREVIARFEEKQRAREALAIKRRAAEEERERHENEIEGLAIYGDCTSEDADRLAARAAELRRLERESERLAEALVVSRHALSARGFEMDRVELLSKRFGSLSHEQQDLLRAQPRLELAFRTELAGIEHTRTTAMQNLRIIDRHRHRRRVPGWVLLAVGLVAAAAGGAGGWLGAPWPWAILIAGGAVLGIVGLVVLIAGSRYGRLDRESAQERLDEAQIKLDRIGEEQHEIEKRLGDLAVTMSYPSVDGLLREWNDYVRLIEESGPTHEIEKQILALERQREGVQEEAGELLAVAGGGTAEPAHLDLIAAGIRQLLAVRERLGDFTKSWAWLDDEQGALEQALEEFHGAGAALLERAGVPWHPGKSWADHLELLGRRVRAAARRHLLIHDLIPQTERQVLDPRTVEDLTSQVLHFTDQSQPSFPRANLQRSQADLEGELDHLRAVIEDLGARRENLRRLVDKSDLIHQQYADKQTDLDRMERALRRARRFRQSVELARATIQSAASDTHKRWAEFLNVRVSELLASFGTKAGQVRFGEDLDFSMRLSSGQQVAHGKAVLQLSSGARDQLHLAVRLAISEYLSRGREPLPLLIDDAFATSDDERTRAGMNLLIQHIVPHHQVILVTCHRKRFEALSALDHELYAGHVNWMEPGSISSVPVQD